MLEGTQNNRTLRAPSDYKVAIVSAEFGLKKRWPLYSGGLGILAGDWLKEAADMGLPVVGLGLAYHKGYFRQRLDENGWQIEEPVDFNPEEQGFHLLNQRARTNINGRDVSVGIYEYVVAGKRSAVPLHLLTTNLDGNSDWDRGLTAKLYDEGGGNKDYYRTAQYRILATGVRLLQSLGYDIETYHLNDGHGALVALELLNQGLTKDRVKEKIWFTTHTPVAAAFDHFKFSEVQSALPREWELLAPYIVQFGGTNYLGTAELAASLSRGINAVSEQHAEVSSKMGIFRGLNVIPITNGIHLPTWVDHHKADLYEQSVPGIFDDPSRFGELASMDYGAFKTAHQKSQQALFNLIEERTGIKLQPGNLTIGFARRGVEYKRADLLFHNMAELARILKDKAQLVFAGKAPPGDQRSKELIQRVWQHCKELREVYGINAVFLPNYGMESAKFLVSGVDVWLNNPRRPEEASGTSGMKVALNGGVNHSVLDGWWAEGYDGNNGWAIGPTNLKNDYATDSADIRLTIEHKILPAFDSGKDWEKLVMESLKLPARFNTRRNLAEYAKKAYLLNLEDRLGIGPAELSPH